MRTLCLLLGATLIFSACSKSEDDTETDGQSQPQGDFTPPEFFAISYTATTSSISVTWSTNEVATGQLEYGTTSSYGSTSPLASNLTAAHNTTINGLSAGVPYYFRLHSKDASGNLGKSSGFIATTTSSADATPPAAVSGLTAPTISPSPALTVKQSTTPVTISWTTSTEGDFAEYRVYRHYAPGVTSSNQLLTTITNVATTNHIDNLTENSYYYYVVYAVDTSGNVSSVSNELAVAKYPIGNVFRLVKNQDLTDDYPNPATSPSPAHYQKPIYFLFCDALAASNGGVPNATRLATNFALFEFVWSATAHAWNHTSFNGVNETTFNYAHLDPSMVNHLQNIRTWYAAALTLNSSFRSPERNANLGGASYSRHMFGDAADIDNPNGTDQPTWQIIANMATAFDVTTAPYCTSATGCVGEGANFVETYSATGGWIHADWRFEKNYAYQNQ